MVRLKPRPLPARAPPFSCPGRAAEGAGGERGEGRAPSPGLSRPRPAPPVARRCPGSFQAVPKSDAVPAPRQPVRAARAAAMASGCPAAFGDPAEVREGFLCPLCLKDLQAFRQLQAHYEEQHPGEDRDVRAQLRNLVQKAKRAKKKLLKQEDDDRTDSGSQERYESFSYGGIDPYMWEPQEVGAMRSRLSEFKKHRAARIDHYVVEVNKLIIRLEKVNLVLFNIPAF